MIQVFSESFITWFSYSVAFSLSVDILSFDVHILSYIIEQSDNASVPLSSRSSDTSAICALSIDLLLWDDDVLIDEKCFLWLLCSNLVCGFMFLDC